MEISYNKRTIQEKSGGRVKIFLLSVLFRFALLMRKIAQVCAIFVQKMGNEGGQDKNGQLTIYWILRYNLPILKGNYEQKGRKLVDFCGLGAPAEEDAARVLSDAGTARGGAG
jgi:hypothetical protein